MKIQILSDLHLEGGINPLLKDFEAVGDVLVLAGDITNALKPSLVEKVFGHVTVPIIYVMGNHEYYRGRIGDTLDKFKDWFRGSQYIQVLEDESVTFDGVTFIGSTFWSYVKRSEAIDVGRFVADFQVVTHNDVDTHNHRHMNAKYHIKRLIEESRAEGIEKQVVVTHFPPSYQAQEARFKSSGLSSYFYSDEEEFVEMLDPSLWIYGHTHGNLRFKIGNVPVECNQLGYTRGSLDNMRAEPCFKDFDLNYIVEV